MTTNSQKITTLKNLLITAATLISLGYVIPAKALTTTKISQPVNDSVTLAQTFAKGDSVSLPGESFTLNGEQRVVKPLGVKDKTILLSQNTGTQQSINFLYLYPVIYTGTAGGGANEYNAPPGGATYDLSLTSQIPPGARILGAWYELNGRISSLQEFYAIDVNIAGERTISLSVTGNPPPSNERMRIRISVMWSY